MMRKEKQNKGLIDSLITIAESSSKTSVVPVSKTGKKTVATTLFDVLEENPYQFKQFDLFYEVHINQLNKSKTLKLETYKLQRSELCALRGWGIHGDSQGKLALIPAEGEKYKELLSNPTIKKLKAYNKN